jgi:hypothetical protein
MLTTPQCYNQIPNKRIGFESHYCQQHCQHHASIWVWGNYIQTQIEQDSPKLDICAVAAVLFMRPNKKKKLMFHAVSIYKIDKALEPKNFKKSPYQTSYQMNTMSFCPNLAR